MLLKRRYSLLFSSLILFHLILSLVQGTEIQWKGTSHGDDPAKSAPKSQRYWDEHNIERPDYAKTDAEIAAERGELLPSYPAVIILLLLIMVGAIYYLILEKKAKGQRLGGSGTGVLGISSQTASYTQGLDEARAREARLARFDKLVEATKDD